MSDTASYNAVKLSDIDAGTNVATAASPAAFILNDDGDVEALFIEDDFANAADDAVYGVINGRTTTTNDSGEKVYKLLDILMAQLLHTRQMTTAPILTDLQASLASMLSLWMPAARSPKSLL